MFLFISLLPSILFSSGFVFVFRDGYVNLKSIQDNPVSLMLSISTREDSFTILSSTSTFHTLLVPLKGDFNYSVTVGGEIAGAGRVVFPDSNVTDFEFGVYGDPRYGDSTHRRIVERLRDIPFVFVLGDMVSNGLDASEWSDAFSILSELKGIVFTAKGNHDFGPLYNLYLYPDDYTVRIGKVRFIVLDSNSVFFLSNLENVLKEYEDEDSFKIVMFHHVIFSCGPHGSDLDTLLRRGAHDLFRKFGVKIVITSHDHNYQRIAVDGITYIVTGGGGASLYGIQIRDCKVKPVRFFERHHYMIGSVHGESLILRVYDIENDLLDEITF